MSYVEKKNIPCVGIVVPTVRASSIQRFFKLWEREFLSYPNIRIFVVEDNPHQSFTISFRGAIEHFSWNDIDRDLGAESWIIPRRTDCIRSYGYFKAYQAGVDVLITLDDDCYPIKKSPYLIRAFLENLERRVSTAWFNTLSGRMIDHSGYYPRGFPYHGRDAEVVLCHGLWDSIPDFDGTTQLQYPSVKMRAARTEAQPVPRGVLFPMCGMNVAIRRAVIPAFYFLLMGEDREGKRWGYHRFGDIWAGIFVKKIIDHLNRAAVTGFPLIHHDRASDPQKNIILEQEGRRMNETLFSIVGAMKLTGHSFPSCYRELASLLPADQKYLKTLRDAMSVWVGLFE